MYLDIKQTDDVFIKKEHRYEQIKSYKQSSSKNKQYCSKQKFQIILQLKMVSSLIVVVVISLLAIQRIESTIDENKFFPKKDINSRYPAEPEFLVPDTPGSVPTRRSNDILLSNYNLTAKLGHNALLPCSVRNIGSYKILWLRVSDGDVLAYDNMLISQDSRFQLIQNTAAESNLFIKGVRLSDAGEYACQLNTQTSKTKFINLLVQSNLSTFFNPFRPIVNWEM